MQHKRPDQDQWYHLFVYTNIDKLFHSLPTHRMLFTCISFPLTGTLKIQNVFLILCDRCATRWSLLWLANQGGKLANTFTKFIFLVQVCKLHSIVPIRWIWSTPKSNTRSWPQDQTLQNAFEDCMEQVLHGFFFLTNGARESYITKTSLMDVWKPASMRKWSSVPSKTNYQHCTEFNKQSICCPSKVTVLLQHFSHNALT